MGEIERGLGGEIGIAGLCARSVGDLVGAQGEELIAGDAGAYVRGVLQENRIGTEIIDDGVARDLQGRTGIGCRGLLGVADDGVILRLRPLLDDVVRDDGVAAIGQVDVIARRAGGPVDNTIVLDDGVGGAALDLVTDDGAGEEAVGDRQGGDVTDVEIVCLAVAGAVVGEFRMIDGDGADGRRARIGAAEQAVLVVMEVVVVEGEIAGLVANARTIAVGHGGAGERHIVDGDVGVGREDRLAVGRRLGRHQIDHAADTLDGDVGGDGGEVVGVGAGLYQNRVAVMRCCNRRGQCIKLLPRAHGQCRHENLQSKGTGKNQTISRRTTTFRD